MLSLNKYLRTSKLLVVCLFLFKNTLTSQNIIQNNSFELYNNIDCGGGGFDNYTTFPVLHVVNNWYAYQSPDYFNSVCTNTYSGMPKNLFGYSAAKDGNSYAGFIAYTGGGNEGKEYIYQPLITQLQAGHSYCLSFFLSRADVSKGAIKNIGAYFSNSLPNMISSSYINVIPQVENQNGFITDTMSWVEIQGCFTAIGGEQYLTIGNFNSNANTDTLSTPTNFTVTGNVPPYYAYYYIDEITLIDQTMVGVNELENENSFEVNPNPTNGIITVSSSYDFDRIELLSITGQTLLSKTVNEKSHQLQLQNFADGIYFVKVFYASGLSVTKKIIVNR